MSDDKQTALTAVAKGDVTYGNPYPGRLTADGTPVHMPMWMELHAPLSLPASMLLRSLLDDGMIQLGGIQAATNAWSVTLTDKGAGQLPSGRATRAVDAGEGR